MDGSSASLESVYGKMVSSTKGKVCVTGASGYLASWLIKRLLEAGYHVLGTVRDPGSFIHVLPFEPFIFTVSFTYSSLLMVVQSV